MMKNLIVFSFAVFIAVIGSARSDTNEFNIYDGVGAIVVDAILVGDQKFSSYVRFNSPDGENHILRQVEDDLRSDLLEKEGDLRIVIRRDEFNKLSDLQTNRIVRTTYFVNLASDASCASPKKVIGSVGLEISKLNRVLGAKVLRQQLFVVSDNEETVRDAVIDAMTHLERDYIVGPINAMNNQ